MASRPIAHVGTVLGLAAIVAGGGACEVTTDAPAAATTGALEVSWNVASLSDPAECTMYGAANLVVQLSDTAGNGYGSYSSPCAAFSMNIPSLPPGSFILTGTMQDGNGLAVSTNAGPVSVVIVAGLTAPVTLAFPTNSFIGQGTTGSLALSWDIAEQQDPASCASHDVDSIHFRLEDASNVLVGTELMQSCTAFATSAQYPAGSYTLSAELYQGSTVRTMSVIAPITIIAAAATEQPVDFPETSFLSP